MSGAFGVVGRGVCRRSAWRRRRGRTRPQMPRSCAAAAPGAGRPRRSGRWRPRPRRGRRARCRARRPSSRRLRGRCNNKPGGSGARRCQSSATPPRWRGRDGAHTKRRHTDTHARNTPHTRAHAWYGSGAAVAAGAEPKANLHGAGEEVEQPERADAAEPEAAEAPLDPHGLFLVRKMVSASGGTTRSRLGP